MSWSFSPVLVAAFSEATSWDTEPSAPSSATPTPDQFYWPDKPMEHSRLSRFGMTCEPLTGDRGEALLTWFRGASPARMSASPAKVTDLTASDPASGTRWPGSFAKWDPASCEWKTHQHSLLGGLERYSETWPRWGSVVVGASYQPQMSMPLTCANESGFQENEHGEQDASPHQGNACLELSAMWRPDGTSAILKWSLDGFGTVYEAEVLLEGVSVGQLRESRSDQRIAPSPSQEEQAGMLRALFVARELAGPPQGPECREQRLVELTDALRELSQQRALEGSEGKWRIELNAESFLQQTWTPPTFENESGSRLWPTPTSGNSHSGGRLDEWGGSRSREAMRALVTPEEQTGPLSPAFPEWLMGWPIGWTDLKPLETAKFREWLQQHGAS